MITIIALVCNLEVEKYVRFLALPRSFVNAEKQWWQILRNSVPRDLFSSQKRNIQKDRLDTFEFIIEVHIINQLRNPKVVIYYAGAPKTKFWKYIDKCKSVTFPSDLQWTAFSKHYSHAHISLSC